jgi:hypothetical protein
MKAHLLNKVKKAVAAQMMIKASQIDNVSLSKNILLKHYTIINISQFDSFF